jgi:hypothetical protein
MTDTELDLLETTLGLKLPPAYRNIMRQFPEELREWPPEPGDTANNLIEDFLLDPMEIVKAQKAARRRLGRGLPPHSFVFGRSGENYWLIRTDVDDPPVKLVFDGMTLDGPDTLAEHLERIRARHQEAWAKAKQRAELSAFADITADELMAEARRLARPAVLLVEEGEKPVGVWRGEGVVPPPEGEWEHWLSFNAAVLPQNPRNLKGVLTVYLCTEDGPRFEEVAVTHDPHGTLPEEPDGQPLFARPFDCLPPMEALFKFGGEPIQNWLQANSADPNHGINPRAFGEQSRQALRAYDKVLSAEHPFGSYEGYAMLGGWSWCFLWCYGIDEEYPWDLLQKALVALTTQDSEPWLEVFDDGAKFVTFSRIT